MSEDWNGFEITGPAVLMDAAEEIVVGTLDADDFLGAARASLLNEETGECWNEKQGLARLAVYLSPDADSLRCGEMLREALDRAFPPADGSEVFTIKPQTTPDQDWATLWRDFFQPVRISDTLVVLPSWWSERDALDKVGLTEGEALTIRIEPGQAFGSGAHATTHLSLEILEQQIEPTTRMLDFGAGSGILSITAAKLGADSIVAIEKDEVAFENFEENAAINGVPGRIEYRIGSSELIRGDEEFDLVVCNALIQEVGDHFPTLVGRLPREGRFIYSGYLTTQTDEVVGRLESLGLRVVASRAREEWSACLAVRE